MSSKRKTIEVEEQSPKPKRRQSAVAKKRTRDDSDDEKVDATVKVSRKKAAVAPEEAPVAAPTPKKQSVKVAAPIPVVSSPAKAPRQSRNSLSSQFWNESLLSSPPPKPVVSKAAPAKTPTPRVPTPVKEETPKKPVVEKFTSPPSTYLPSPAAKGSRWSAHEVIIDDEDDGKVGFWKQACCTLKTSMAVITPIFLLMIFFSYVIAAVITDHSVAIASMGITFCLVLVLILSSYTVAVLPSIYVSRLFTALVLTPNDATATQWPWQWKRNLNFYSTFTALCVLAVLSLTIVLSV